MTDLNYTLRFNKEQLRIDIRDRLGLEPSFRDKDIKERDRIAGETIDEILKQGSFALYQGLIQYGIKIAMRG